MRESARGGREDGGDRDVSFQIESDNQHLIDTIQVGDTVAFDLYKGRKRYEAKAIKIICFKTF